MVRLGLAGLGVHGMRYAGHLLRAEVPGARLVAVWRRDEVSGLAFAREHGLRFARAAEELAAMEGVDAVVAVLPPDLHERVARAAIAFGRPLLVEKPLAASARAASEIVRETRARGAFAMVAHTLRFDPLVRALREQVPSLGRLRLVAINQRFEPSNLAWLDEPGRGGIALNTGVHAFDLLRFLTGAEPVSVAAETASFATRRTEDGLVAAVRLEPGGLLATVDNCRATGGRSGGLEVVGEHGQLRADHVHRAIFRVEGREETAVAVVPPVPTVAEVLEAFVRALEGGLPPPVTVEDGAVADDGAEAALLSARLGRRVRLDEVRSGSAGGGG